MPTDYNTLNDTMLDCYVSPQTMWEGIMAPRQKQNNKEAKHQKRIQVGPFFVSTVVNEGDMQLIHYVFEYSHEKDKVFSSPRSFLNQSEFITLKPQTHLDAWVIDAFAEILTDIEQKKPTRPLNWYLPVMFSKAALDNVSSFVDFVSEHKIRENYMSPDLVYCEKIFVPVHFEKHLLGHFYLYVVHMKNQVVEIWDSLFNDSVKNTERAETTQKLLFAMENLFPNVKFTEFHRTMAIDILLQPNGYDCGIFVINYMQQSNNYVKGSRLFLFDSEEERLDLALKLLKSDLNNVKETLYHRAAKRHNTHGENDEDSNVSRFKRKRVDTCKTCFEVVGRGACIELNDSNCRVRRTDAGLKTGCPKGYILPTTDLVGKQFQCYIKKIWKWIMDDDVSAIGIWGMGGAGKTALSTHIHNKLLEEAASDFDQVIWVSASQHESICQLQKVVARSIYLDISDEFEVKRIAGKLLQAFKHMNKCALFLDDVWNHIFLEEVGFPISDNQIKLILTTRIWEVCQGMGCKKNVIKVEPLNKDDSRALFEKTLGVDGGLSLELEKIAGNVAVDEGLSLEVEKIARNVADECGGLPLAIVTIARSMRGKEHVREWSHMLKCLRSLHKGHYDMDKWVFPILKSSYAQLNNELQRCFLYFALLSKDIFYDDDVDEHLIRRFVYEGLIDGTMRLEEQYNELYNVLDKLKNISLLRESSYMKWGMHKFLRAMAISIAKETAIMAKVHMDLIEIPDDDEWKEDLQKIFLTGNNIHKIPDGTSPRCSQLSTLLLDYNKDLNWMPDDFFNNMLALKVLDLSETGIEFLPESVSNLKCLIALLLSGCRTLKYMPSLAKLQRLISLDLYATGITEAPSGLEMLFNLRCLNLLHTSQLKMSTSVISKMTNLESLSLNCIPKAMDVGAQDLQGLNKLKDISANFCDIQEFNDYVKSCKDRNRVLERYHLSLHMGEDYTFVNEFGDSQINECKSLKRVVFYGMDFGKEAAVLPEDINELFIYESHLWARTRCLCHALSFNSNFIGCPRREHVLLFSKKNNLHKIELLQIKRCNVVENLCCVSPSCPFWASVQLVQGLVLEDLEDLKSIVSPFAPSLHESTLFSHLKELNVYGCNSIKTLLTPELLAQLQNLDTMNVGACESMEEIVGQVHSGLKLSGSSNVSDYTITLPKVTDVNLWNLPELNFVYRGIMLCPSLRVFYANKGNKLRCPQIELSNGSALQLKENPTSYSWNSWGYH